MSGDRIAERAAEHLATVAGSPRFQALTEAERMDWARGEAERELADVPWLPGGLSWTAIEGAYRMLAKRTPVYHVPPFRRSKPDRPTRPEVALELQTTVPTLDRACIAAGRGKHWPPRGL